MFYILSQFLMKMSSMIIMLQFHHSDFRSLERAEPLQRERELPILGKVRLTRLKLSDPLNLKVNTQKHKRANAHMNMQISFIFDLFDSTSSALTDIRLEKYINTAFVCDLCTFGGFEFCSGFLCCAAVTLQWAVNRCELIRCDWNASLKGCQLTWPPFPLFSLFFLFVPLPYSAFLLPPSLPPPSAWLTAFLLSSCVLLLYILSDLPSLTLLLHTMKAAHGKHDKMGTTSLNNRSHGSIYLPPPWELHLLTPLQLRQLEESLWGVSTGSS